METRNLKKIIGVSILLLTLVVFIISIFYSFKTFLKFPGISYRFGGLERGTVAPDFTLSDLDGNKMKLSDFKNKKIVLINFWATWCSFCKKQLPEIQKFYEKYRDKIEILAISEDYSKEKVKKFMQKNKYGFKVLMDRNMRVQNLYLVFGLPCTVLVNKEGKIRSIHQGYNKDLVKILEDEVRTPTKYELAKKERKFESYSKSDNTYILYLRGKRYMDRGKFKEAIETFEKLTKVDPEYSYAYNHLCYLYAQIGEYEKAIDSCKKNLKINPNEPWNYRMLAYLYSMTGKQDEVIKNYKKLVELTPNSSEAHNYLGESYLNLGKIDEAIKEFQKAVKLNLNNFEIRIALGRAYNMKGLYNEAILQLKEAIKINPKSSNPYYELGLVYENKDEKTKAKEEYKKALKINPYNLNAKLALKRLK